MMIYTIKDLIGIFAWGLGVGAVLTVGLQILVLNYIRKKDNK